MPTTPPAFRSQYLHAAPSQRPQLTLHNTHPPRQVFFAFLFFLPTSFTSNAIIPSAGHSNTPPLSLSLKRRLSPEPNRKRGKKSEERRREHPKLTRRQTLLYLIRLTRILQNQRIQIAFTPNLKLDLSILGFVRRDAFLLTLLDAGGFGVLSSCDFEELFDVGDFGGHGCGCVR